jgi:hypothetical protein
MRLHRADPLLNDAILALDQRLHEARRRAPKSTAEEQRVVAWQLLSPAELSFVRDEIEHVARSRRYFLGNYHVIQPESGVLTCLSPLYDHQEMVDQVLTSLLATDGQARVIVLKPRQSGLTEYCTGVMCWRTFFLPHAYTISVAQAPDVAAHIQRKITLAYNSLPWWMQVEKLYHTKGEFMEFGRKDVNSDDPGLGSVVITTHAQRTTGVAIGRTCRSAHCSEVSRWPDGEVWTGDIEPSMNAPDAVAFMESTAFGSEGFYYNLWEEAVSGDSDWTPVFLAAYRAKKYSLPIKPSQQPFVLTAIEQSFTDRVRREESGHEITPEFWNWRRKRIKASVSRTGFPYAHFESFPITAQEAFQSSGLGAFPRHKLDEQQQRSVARPEWIGEIGYTGKQTPPVRWLNHMHDDRGQYLDVAVEKRELTNRLHVWEQPDPSACYYVGVDVGDGILGGDFSVAEVFRAGYGLEPDCQVAEWVGYEPPIAFAKIVYALGWWYNQAEVAIEYAREGMSCANEFALTLEYPKVYVPRHPDKRGNQLTTYLHWQTTSKTKPYLMTRMNESLLEDGVVIRSQYLLDELRRCVKDASSFTGQGGHDDAAVAGCIAHYCLRETMPELRRGAGDAGPGAAAASALARALHPPLGSVIYGVYDEVLRLRAQSRDLTKAEQAVAQHPGWSVRPLRVTQANTAYSPIYHGNGIARELYLGGMQDRDVTPDLLTLYGAATGRDELARAFGGGARQDGAGDGGGEWGGGMDGTGLWDSALGDYGELG